MTPKTIDQLLDEARAQLDRLSPREAAAAVKQGALLVDIRAESQRERDGIVPEAVFIPRNVLEWRAVPHPPGRGPERSAPQRPASFLWTAGLPPRPAPAALHPGPVGAPALLC